MNHRCRTLLFIPTIVPLLLGSACGGSSKGADSAASASELPLVLEHEPCDVNSATAEKSDNNGDGRPDIVRVLEQGKERCRAIDLNHDGKPDSFIYTDSDGRVRRRESDYDRDGRLDEVVLYSGGIIQRKDRETNLDGKLDTWDFYEGGKLRRRSRDSDGDGRVDQWWTWANPDKIECAVIASDHNHDGKPDPDDVIDVCAVAAAASGPANDGGAMPADSGGGASSDAGTRDGGKK